MSRLLYRRLLAVGLVVSLVQPVRAVQRQTVEYAAVPGEYAFGYLLDLPQGYAASPPAGWPLLVFLHGSGERGTVVERVAAAGLPQQIEQGRELPGVIVSPQCATAWWDPSALEPFIQDMILRYHIDPDRVYVTGLSMGGFGTWDLAVRHPERYAAVVPICGGGDVAQAYKLRDLPLWAFHGNLDTTVPVSRTLDMITAIRQAGGNPLVSIYPDLGHDAWTVTYANDTLYDWLFEQSRANSPATAAPQPADPTPPMVPVTPNPPAQAASTGGSSGGGGALSDWFLAALMVLGPVRRLTRR